MPSYHATTGTRYPYAHADIIRACVLATLKGWVIITQGLLLRAFNLIFTLATPIYNLSVSRPEGHMFSREHIDTPKIQALNQKPQLRWGIRAASSEHL